MAWRGVARRGEVWRGVRRGGVGGSWGWDVAAAHRIGGAAWQHQGDLLPHDSKPACVHVHAMSCAWHVMCMACASARACMCMCMCV